MRLPRRGRPAFRLVELAMVIAIVAILLGLLLPGLHKSKRVAINAQCFNNLKNIVLGSHNYASAYGNALPALTSDIAKPGSCPYNGGIFFSLLPFVDFPFAQDAALNSTRPDATWSAHILPEPPGTPAFQARPINYYRCPVDDTIINGLSGNQTTAPNTWAACSYAANYQVFGTVNNLSTDGTPTPGSGNYCGPKYDIGNIPDGTSNTIFFGEQLAACGPAAGSLWAYPGIGNYSDTTAYPVTPAGTGIINTPTVTNSASWTPVFANSHAIYGFTAGGLNGSVFQYNTQDPAPDPIGPPYAAGMYWDAPPQTGITQTQCDKSRLQAFHSPAVLVGMGDGSVRTVSAGVSQHSWYCAIVPDDGTPFDGSW